MDTIFLYNQNNERFETEVIRYFSIGDKKYLIFTLNEKDEDGYVQLYVAKIEKLIDKLVTKTISDDEEWNKFKEEIQKIVVNNRNNIKNTTDLDFSELNNVVVTEFKIFKLKENVAKELSEYKNVVHEVKEPITLEAASAQNNGLTIEEMLKNVSDNAKIARESIILENNNNAPAVEEFHPIKVQSISPLEESIDYKVKYDTLLETVKKLENENIKLINELVDVKAKLETIKDII